jgi:DNA-binding transcriptional ArsR family regulator
MGTAPSAADVFQLLADETRLDVLRAVAAAQHQNRRTGVADLSFSELYERVDVDSTSKLSYHLGELTGVFLRKHGGSYAFTHAGEQLVRFVLAENYQSPPAVGPVETEGCCLFCEATRLHAAVEDQYFTVRCSDCSEVVYAYRVTPAQLRPRTEEEVIDAVIREQAGDLLKARDGLCPDCAGSLQTAVTSTAAESDRDDVPQLLGTISECRQCRRSIGLPLTHRTALHPESIAFHWEHGVDILGTAVWEFNRRLNEDLWTAERVDTDRAEYRVELRCGDDTVRLSLDETATVTRTERVRHRDLGERGT